MRKSVTTKALYAGSFDPVTRGHLDIIGKALLTFDTVHVAVGTNVRKVRMFGIEESQRLIVRSIMERWPEEASTSTDAFEGALEVGEFTNQSLIAYARKSGRRTSCEASVRRAISMKNSTCMASQGVSTRQF